MSFKDPSGFLAGVIRPVVTGSLVAAVVVATFTGLLPADKVFEMAMMTTGFWFASRPSAPPSGGAAA